MYQFRVHRHTCALCSACCCKACDSWSTPKGVQWHSSYDPMALRFYLILIIKKPQLLHALNCFALLANFLRFFFFRSAELRDIFRLFVSALFTLFYSSVIFGVCSFGCAYRQENRNSYIYIQIDFYAKS